MKTAFLRSHHFWLWTVALSFCVLSMFPVGQNLAHQVEVSAGVDRFDLTGYNILDLYTNEQIEDYRNVNTHLAFENLQNQKVLYDFHNDSQVLKYLKSKNLPSNQPISFSQNTDSETLLTFRINHLEFPNSFSLIFEGSYGEIDGDAFGGDDCSDQRFMVHTPAHQSFHFFLGTPGIHTASFGNEMGPGVRFTMIVSKESSGLVSVAVDHVTAKFQASDHYKNSFKVDLTVGNSGCNIPFTGKISRLSVLDGALTSNDLRLLAMKLKASNHDLCPTKDLATCIR